MFDSIKNWGYLEWGITGMAGLLLWLYLQKTKKFDDCAARMQQLMNITTDAQ